MAATKVVMVFNGQTSPGGSAPAIGYTGQSHQFGFTEMWWSDSGSVQQITNFLNTDLALKRAALLPGQVQYIGARLYIAGGGKGIVVPFYISGAPLRTLNTAFDALLCTTTAPGAPRQRKFWLHCVPDGEVQNGEYTGSNSYDNALRAYFTSLGQGWFYSTSQPNLTQIATISSTGTVTLKSNSPFAANQRVVISRTLDSTGRKRGGHYVIATIGPLPTQFVLTGWQWGATTGGTVYAEVDKSLVQMNGGNGIQLVRAGRKGVGRPTALYRGRRSARH